MPNVPRRDAVDLRVAENAIAGTGLIVDTPSDVGGWPTYVGAVAPPDGDHDGMPDAWELERGLDPADPADGALDRNGDGWTNVEEYLDDLVPPWAWGVGVFADGFESGGSAVP